MSTYKANSQSLKLSYSRIIASLLLTFSVLLSVCTEFHSTPQIHSCFQTQLKFVSPQVKNSHQNFMAMVFSFDIVWNFYFFGWMSVKWVHWCDFGWWVLCAYIFLGDECYVCTLSLWQCKFCWQKIKIFRFAKVECT